MEEDSRIVAALNLDLLMPLLLSILVSLIMPVPVADYILLQVCCEDYGLTGLINRRVSIFALLRILDRIDDSWVWKLLLRVVVDPVQPLDELSQHTVGLYLVS